jgi:hypothetical protein
MIVYGRFQLSTITYGIHPFKNGLPVNSGQPENFVETRSQKGKYLASEYDNMFYNTSKLIELIKDHFFYKNFGSLKEARMISDHIPIWFEFSLN